MDKQTKQMIAAYEKAVNAIAVAFLNKQIDDPEEPPITDISGDYFWAGDDVGSGLSIAGECFYDFSDILTDIKEDAPVGEIDEYQEYCTRCIDLGLEPNINYHAWLHGAPRTPDSTLDTLEKMKRDLEEKIKEAKDGKEV